MNKKGLLDIVRLSVNLIIIIIVSMFILMVILKYQNEDIKTTSLETFLLAKKLIYSDSCLAYKEGNKIYQGVIDMNKLSFDRLNSCATKESLGYIVTVQDLNNNPVKSASNLNLRQQSYLPVCGTINGYECLNRSELISYYDNKEMKTGHMQLEVINFVG